MFESACGSRRRACSRGRRAGIAVPGKAPGPSNLKPGRPDCLGKHQLVPPSAHACANRLPRRKPAAACRRIAPCSGPRLRRRSSSSSSTSGESIATPRRRVRGSPRATCNSSSAGSRGYGASAHDAPPAASRGSGGRSSRWGQRRRPFRHATTLCCCPARKRSERVGRRQRARACGGSSRASASNSRRVRVHRPCAAASAPLLLVAQAQVEARRGALEPRNDQSPRRHRGPLLLLLLLLLRRCRAVLRMGRQRVLRRHEGSSGGGSWPQGMLLPPRRLTG